MGQAVTHDDAACDADPKGRVRTHNHAGDHRLAIEQDATTSAGGDDHVGDLHATGVDGADAAPRPGLDGSVRDDQAGDGGAHGANACKRPTDPDKREAIQVNRHVVCRDLDSPVARNARDIPREVVGPRSGNPKNRIRIAGCVDGIDRGAGLDLVEGFHGGIGCGRRVQGPCLRPVGHQGSCSQATNSRQQGASVLQSM